MSQRSTPKSTPNPSPWFIWLCGTAASVLMTWIISSAFAHAGYRFLLRYWAIGLGIGSMASGVAAVVSTRPTQQGALNSLQKAAESLEATAEQFQQTGQTVSHSMDTFLNAVSDQADRTQQLGNWLQQMYEASLSGSQQAEITASTEHADRHPTTSSSVPDAVPHSRVHSPRATSESSPQTPEDEDELELINLLSDGNDFGLSDGSAGDLWGSPNRLAELSDRRAG